MKEGNSIFVPRHLRALAAQREKKKGWQRQPFP
jgi:hypothetical protein